MLHTLLISIPPNGVSDDALHAHTVPSYTRIDDASHIIGVAGGPAGQALAGPIF